MAGLYKKTVGFAYSLAERLRHRGLARACTHLLAQQLQAAVSSRVVEERPS
jgi:hypothetical protein